MHHQDVPCLQISKDSNTKETRTIIFDHNCDPKYHKRPIGDFVKAASPDGLYRMIEDGKYYGQCLEEQGYFRHLYRL
jgi:hypothetical protein